MVYGASLTSLEFPLPIYFLNWNVDAATGVITLYGFSYLLDPCTSRSLCYDSDDIIFVAMNSTMNKPI